MQVSKKVIILILLAELCLTLFSILTSRIPRGHDGFIQFGLQYYFLNGIFNGGNISQWMPYMTQGTVATWWYAITATPGQSIFYLWGKLATLPHNFILIYHLSTIILVFILAIGTERLASRYTRFLGTRFFILAAVLGSSIGYDQPWYGLDCFYAIPLTLYLLHLFWESGKWRYFFLCGNFLALQHLGNLPYYIPVATFAISVYACTFCALHFKQISEKIHDSLFSRYSLAAVTGIILSFGTVYFLSIFATNEIANYNYQRNLDGTASLETFLDYGGHLHVKTMLELLLGISPVEDFTFYLGCLSIPSLLAYFAFGIKKSNFPVFITSIALTLLMLGSIFSTVLYYFWPMMKYFRHLLLIITFIKPFLCILAGIGAETAWLKLKTTLGNRNIYFYLFLIGILTVWAAALLGLLYHVPKTIHLLSGLLIDKLPPFDFYRIEGSSFPALMSAETLIPLLLRTLLIVVALMTIVILLFISNWKRSARLFSICGIALICIQVVDLYSYKASQLLLRTVAIPSQFVNLFDFQTFPYHNRRVVDFWQGNSRAHVLEEILPFKALKHWTLYNFTFTDAITIPFRTDHWLQSIDQVFRAYLGLSLDQRTNRTGDVVGDAEFVFPTQEKSVRVISGLDQDKIQFFDKVTWETDAQKIAKIISSPTYLGTVPVLEPQQDVHSYVQPLRKAFSSPLLLHYHVQRFLPDHLELTVENPSINSIWLYRSEAFHPFWHATVNGIEVPIYKANLGYQAIPINPGFNHIQFQFGSENVSYLQYFVALVSLAWIIGLGILVLI